MDKLKVILEVIFDFIERRIPWLLIGYKLGQGKTDKVQAELNEKELELEYAKNENTVLKNNIGKSDSDIIDEHLNSPDSPTIHPNEVSGSIPTKKTD